MQRAKRFLILALLVCLSTVYGLGMECQAEEMSGEQTSAGSGLEDENSQRLDEVTGMDEEGNIFEVGEAGGQITEPGIAMFSMAESVKVVNFRTKGNAVTNYTEYGTKTAGYTNGAYGADAAYLGTEGNKVRFMLSGVVGEVAASEVQVVEFSTAQSVSCYKAENGRLLHYITQDMTKPGHATSLDNGAAPSYLQGGVTYYSYDGHYFYTDYGTMLSDYQNKTRANSVNANSPHYNYYQYLPFRSRTAYSGAELNNLIAGKTQASSKLRNAGDYFVNSQNTYGVNALIMAGIAANESGWGTSSISQSKNNLFGLNAVDSSPGASANAFTSVEECIRQFADNWMSRGYLDPGSWKYNGGFLGNKASGVNVKYASDPYWGEKAANIIWLLDQNGGSRDANAYTIGIKDTLATGHASVNVRSGSSTSNPQLYMTGRASNYAVLIQDPAAENSFYRIQSDAVLNDDRTAVNKGTGKYDFDHMYAYISSNYVTPVNQGGAIAPPAAKVLDSIYISQAPVKTEYTAGEVFDATGMVVAARWSDNTESDVTSEITYSTDLLQAGTGSIVISYTNEGKTVTAEQTVVVNAPADNITEPEPSEPSADDDTPDTGTQPTEPVQPPTDTIPSDTLPSEPEPVPEQPPTSAATPDTVAPVPEPEPVQQPTEPSTDQASSSTDNTVSEDLMQSGVQSTDGVQQASGQTSSSDGEETQQPGDIDKEPVFQPVAAGTADQDGKTLSEDKSGDQAASSISAGESVSSNKQSEKKAPKTGDESNLMLWSILFMCSMTGIISCYLRRKEAEKIKNV